MTLGASLQRAHPFLEVVGVQAQVSVAALLLAGHGERSARRRASAIAEWFDATHRPAWWSRGFGRVAVSGAEVVTSDGVRRWALRLTMSAPEDDAAAWHWAAEREAAAS